MGIIGKLLTWILLALACNYVIKLVLILDWNKSVYGHSPGPCKTIKGIEFGAEDIEVLSDDLVLVTSGLRLKSGDKKEQTYVRGRVFAVTLTKGQENILPTAKETTIRSSTLNKDTFNPHGMSSYKTPNGVTHIYIINHPPNGTDTVECFTYKRKENILIHQKSITDPLIYTANNLVATGAERFYLTNDHYFRHPFLQDIETMTLSSLGSVIYYNGKKGMIVDQWLQSPNGVAINKNQTSLYVALPLQEVIRVYKIMPDDNIVKVSDMSLLSSPDNIYYESPADELWTGCHPVAHQIAKHLRKPKSATSPSQVLRVRPGQDHSSWTITEPYSDDGKTLSGSSVSVYVNENLLIGTIHHKLMWCPVPDRELL